MNYKIPIYFVFLAAVWGASFMFMRVGAPELGAYAFSGLRVGIAGLILSPILLKPSCFKEYKEHWLKLSLIGILNTGIPFMLFTLATYHLTAGVTSVINASVPVMTGVISHFFFKYYLSKQQFLGLIIGILGVALLMLDGLQGEGSIWAFISALGACLCYAMSSNLAKRYLFAISPMTIAASGLLASGIVMLPIVILFFPQNTISWTAWSSVFAIAVLSTAIAMIVFYQLIQLLDPTKTAMVTLFIPIFGIFWGVLLLDEKVSLQMLLGTVIILLGTALTIFRRKSINVKS